MQHDHVLKKLHFDLLTTSPGAGEGGLLVKYLLVKYLLPVLAALVIPGFIQTSMKKNSRTFQGHLKPFPHTQFSRTLS